MDLEEELKDVPVGGPLGIEDDLDRLGVTRMVVRVPAQARNEPPARIAVWVFSLIAALPRTLCCRSLTRLCRAGRVAICYQRCSCYQIPVKDIS